MRRGKRILGFWVLTICLVLVSAFCITGTVMSRCRPEEQELENYYREKEKELVRDTRNYLCQAGYQNSGVTLTRVVEVDGSREYTVTVHHGKIDRMDEESREDLKKELSSLHFSADNCTFFHEFLIAD